MAAARNRWGTAFRKGDCVEAAHPRGGMSGPYYYVKLAPTDDFSRAYGRQAIVASEPPRGRHVGQTHEVGLDDLRKCKSGG